ncbi:heptaprenyl diphosphate synthase component II [Siminovitchia sp. FSL H7-0308]|uniref:Heptaprenyl diphosphate synthase n=1 Tax=Siminovitchia thermophila TaxID=1245522 RepID=A0ABS2R1V6_9BACI|nr:heptaprenyl diphosphate synthase component II [Siminovitchia thermophila]MBM7713631.1 heptaprenyl diphosphate synthase [Siminovitchia thermophila]ONK21904.1 heptaprenyl diphosphate synthase component II [Bacillus sp. VT-16-64]
MKLKRLYSTFKYDLDLIEKELENAVCSNSTLLQNASLQLLKAGGKRIRPVFVLLSAQFGEYKIDTIKNVALALELIHMASLVHDDVIDEADTRRGRPTINYTWDDRMAMYTGDFIFARSLEYMTNISNPIAHKKLAKAIVEVCIGEMVQIQDKFRFDQTIRDYLRRIKRKTALLIAVSCELGAIAGKTDERIYRRLYKFGYYIGMSFQITDDILDFTATEKELGKPAGEDLRQGNITLPALYAMQIPELKAEIIKVNEDTNKEEMQKIIHLIKHSGAIEKSHLLSRRYLDKALHILQELPANRAKRPLQEIANYIGKRRH